MLERLKQILQNIINSNFRMTPSEILYNTALTFIGTDASPRDKADDDVACAESVDTICQKAFGRYMGGTMPILSTAVMYSYMKNNDHFKQIDRPATGCIVISPTGSKGSTGNGHTGICGNYQIMSNDSRSGTWEGNYTREGWARLFARRGFPTYYFLPV